jgi:hypothetical protein
MLPGRLQGAYIGRLNAETYVYGPWNAPLCPRAARIDATSPGDIALSSIFDSTS